MHGGLGNVERLAAIVALHDRDHLGAVAAHIFEPSKPEEGMQAEVISVCTSTSFFWIS
jgi:hypothetical protein